MILNNFKGGLDGVNHPSLLPLNEAVVYENIDPDTGKLISVQDKVATQEHFEGAYGYYFIEEDKWKGSNIPLDTIEYGDKFYYTNRQEADTVQVKYLEYDGPLQFVVPMETFTLTKSSQTGEVIYKYSITLVNKSTRFESVPVRLEITALTIDETNTVTISKVGNLPPLATHVKIYRLGAELTERALIQEVAVEDIVGDTVFVDNVPDIDQEAQTLRIDVTQSFIPTGLKYLTEYKGTFFAADKEKIYWSVTGHPELWRTLSFISMPTAVTGIGAIPAGLMVFTDFSSFLISGIRVANVEVEVTSVAEDEGCISQESIQSHAERCIWLSSSGICVSAGYDYAVITQLKFGDREFSAKSSLMYNNEYHLFQQDNTSFIIDFNHNIARIENHRVGNIAAKKDEIFGISNNQLFRLYANKDLTSFKYRSGWLVPGGLAVLKIFTRVYFFARGPLIIVIYLDGKEVGREEVPKQEELEVVDIMLDQRKAYYMEIEVEGKGQILEIRSEEGAADGA